MSFKFLLYLSSFLKSLGVFFIICSFYFLYLHLVGLNSLDKFKHFKTIHCSSDFFTMDISYKSFVLDVSERFYFNPSNNIVFYYSTCE